jgi:hypothetical protein
MPSPCQSGSIVLLELPCANARALGQEALATSAGTNLGRDPPAPGLVGEYAKTVLTASLL